MQKTILDTAEVEVSVSARSRRNFQTIHADSIEICAVNRAVIPAIRALHAECLPVVYDSPFFESLTTARSGTHAACAFLVDQSGSRVAIGFISAREEEDEASIQRGLDACSAFCANFTCPWSRSAQGRQGYKTGYIMTLGVSSAYRGHGVGRRLLQWATSALEARGCRAIALHCLSNNDSAQALYASQGFTLIHHCPGHYSIHGQLQDAVYLRKGVVSRARQWYERTFIAGGGPTTSSSLLALGKSHWARTMHTSSGIDDVGSAQLGRYTSSASASASTAMAGAQGAVLQQSKNSSSAMQDDTDAV